jgi:hypothetical protein
MDIEPRPGGATVEHGPVKVSQHVAHFGIQSWRQHPRNSAPLPAAVSSTVPGKRAATSSALVVFTSGSFQASNLMHQTSGVGRAVEVLCLRHL